MFMDVKEYVKVQILAVWATKGQIQQLLLSHCNLADNLKVNPIPLHAPESWWSGRCSWWRWLLQTGDKSPRMTSRRRQWLRCQRRKWKSVWSAEGWGATPLTPDPARTARESRTRWSSNLEHTSKHWHAPMSTVVAVSFQSKASLFPLLQLLQKHN